MAWRYAARVRSGSEAFRGPPQLAAQRGPVESIARVALAPRRHMFVPGDVTDGVMLCSRREQGGQGFVLRELERCALDALQLDADREVVAVLPPLPRRSAGVPRPVVAAHELPEL